MGGTTTSLLVLGLSQLCQHDFEHNRMAKASNIMPAKPSMIGKIVVQSPLCTQELTLWKVLVRFWMNLAIILLNM